MLYNIINTCSIHVKQLNLQMLQVYKCYKCTLDVHCIDLSFRKVVWQKLIFIDCITCVEQQTTTLYANSWITWSSQKGRVCYYTDHPAHSPTSLSICLHVLLLTPPSPYHVAYWFSKWSLLPPFHGEWKSQVGATEYTRNKEALPLILGSKANMTFMKLKLPSHYWRRWSASLLC